MSSYTVEQTTVNQLSQTLQNKQNVGDYATNDNVDNKLKTNVINYTNNRLLEIPQDIKLELNNGTSTLDSYMVSTQNRIDLYRNQQELGTETVDDEATYKLLLEYTQYLRDFPNNENWWLLSPLVFEKFVSLKAEKDENNANL